MKIGIETALLKTVKFVRFARSLILPNAVK
jgi:hypothetical protein